MTTVYTDHVRYTINPTYEDDGKMTTIPNCNLRQTTYGSVVIERENSPKIELYPSKITHIIY